MIVVHDYSRDTISGTKMMLLPYSGTPTNMQP